MSITGDHDVVGLQVAMDNARSMSLRQSLSHVLQVSQQPSQFSALAMNLVAKRNAFHKLHGNEVRAVVLPDLENLCNVGMVQRRCRFRLPNESLHPIAIRG